MKSEDHDQQRQSRLSPLDYLSAASIGVTAIGFFSLWFPQGLVQGISAFVMGIGLACAFTITLFRMAAVPLAVRFLDKTDRTALQHLSDSNRETSGIVFQRSRGSWTKLVGRVAGPSYHDFGYRVFMQCPERLWGHGCIGQVLGLNALQGDEFDHVFHGGGPVGQQVALERLQEFVETHDRRFGATAESLLEIENLVRVFYKDTLQLLLPDARAKALLVVEVDATESPNKRVESITYQLESMLMAADFLRTVHYRLTKTYTETISSTEIEAQPAYHPPAEYTSLPLLLSPGSKVMIDHDRWVELMFSQAHEALVLGWVIGQRCDIDDEDMGRTAKTALDDIMVAQSEHPVSSLQELADRTLKRFDDIRSDNDG